MRLQCVRLSDRVAEARWRVDPETGGMDALELSPYAGRASDGEQARWTWLNLLKAASPARKADRVYVGEGSVGVVSATRAGDRHRRDRAEPCRCNSVRHALRT